MKRIPFFGGCLAPIALVLLINIIIFILVVRQLHSFYTGKNLDKTIRRSTSIRLKGVVGLLVLLGLTWLFAIFAVGGVANLIFNYLFVICNASQGLFLFLFNCLGKADVRKAWREQLTGDSSATSSSKSKHNMNGRHWYNLAFSVSWENSASVLHSIL